MLYPSLCSLLPLLYHSTPTAPPSTVLYTLLIADRAQSEVLTCRAAAVAACVNFDHLI